MSKVIKRGQIPEDYSFQSVPTSETTELRPKDVPRDLSLEAAAILGRRVLKLRVQRIPLATTQGGK